MQAGVSENEDDDATLDITDLKHEGKLAICITLLDYKIMICVYIDIAISRYNFSYSQKVSHKKL